MNLPAPIYAHISGIDRSATATGSYYVLEDNLRTPSGVSYMLEGRNVSESLLPEVFARQQVRPVSSYPQQLYDTFGRVQRPRQPEYRGAHARPATTAPITSTLFGAGNECAFGARL